LEDRTVLNALPGGFRWLKRNQRADVILYFKTYADLLEEQLIAQIPLPSFNLKGEPSAEVAY
jgi:hypothetical protein